MPTTNHHLSRDDGMHQGSTLHAGTAADTVPPNGRGPARFTTSNEDEDMIDIEMSNAEVLMRLYNRARTQGLGFLHFTPEDMTLDEAQQELDRRASSPGYYCNTYFDYHKGRVMKIDVARRPLDPRLYDRDNGQGAALSALTEPL